MARFDIHRRLDGPGYLLDLQSDLLRDLNTRFVVPLLPAARAPKPAGRLNPVFTIEAELCVMVTQFAGAVQVSELGSMIGSLLSEDTTIIGALDMLTGV